MFAANLTLGLYVSFGPKSLTRNSTVGLESVPLGGTEQTLVTPTSYITLVPLLATMLFIMIYLFISQIFLKLHHIRHYNRFILMVTKRHLPKVMELSLE